MPEITDEDSARAYFERQSVEVRCILTSRAALRVLAIVSGIPDSRFFRVSLSNFRAILTSAGRGLGRPNDVDWLQAAARSAADAATPAAAESANAVDSTVSALSAARSAAESANLAVASVGISDAYIARSAAYAALSKDAENPSFAAPLWPVLPAPTEIRDNDRAFLTRIRSEGFEWFPDWYEAMWEGTFYDWDFALAVAKIDDAVWDAGLDAVNIAIRELQDQRLSDTLTQAEEVTLNDDGDFVVRGTLVDPHAVVVTSLSQMDFLLDEAVQSNRCDLSHLCLAYKILDKTRRLNPDDPAAIEQDFRRARDLIQRNLDRGDYTREDIIEALVDTLAEGVMNMRATHPVLQELFEKRSTLALKTMGDDTRARLADDYDGMTEDGTAGRLQEDYALGAEIIRAEPGSDAERATVEQGGFRAAEIAKKAKDLESSGGMSAAKIGLRAQSIVETILSLF